MRATDPLNIRVLTCSFVSGNQYMQGVAFVFLKRSSNSFAGGGSSSFFLNLRAGAGRWASNAGLRLLCRRFLSSFFSRSFSLMCCWPSSLPKSHSLTTVTWHTHVFFVRCAENNTFKYDVTTLSRKTLAYLGRISFLLAAPLLLPRVGRWERLCLANDRLVLGRLPGGLHVLLRGVFHVKLLWIRHRPGDPVKRLPRLEGLVLVGILSNSDVTCQSKRRHETRLEFGT